MGFVCIKPKKTTPSTGGDVHYNGELVHAAIGAAVSAAAPPAATATAANSAVNCPK